MAIDLYTPRTLRGVVARMPRAKTFIRDLLFTDVQTFPTEKVEFDMVKGGRELAPFVHPRLGAEVLANQGYQTKEYTAPLVSPSTVTTAEDLMKRAAGEHIYSGKSPASRAVAKIANDMQRMDETITRREEWMAAKTLFEGKIPVVGKGINSVIDFNFTNNITLTSDKWSDNSAPIMDQMEEWYKMVQKNGYVNPNIAIIGTKAAQAIVNNEKMQKLLDTEHYNLASIAPKQLANGAIWIGRIGKLNLDLYQYNEWYVDNWTDPENPVTEELVPENKIVMFSTAAKFSRLYGAVTYIPYGEKDFITEEGDRVAKAWIAHNPDRKFLGLDSRPLTVPHEVDSWLVAEVL